MREFSNQAVLSMSDSTMAVSSKYTQDLSVQIVFFTFSCKWFLCFYFWAVIWSYIVDLFAALHELTSAITRTLLKLASLVRALLKPYEDTLSIDITCLSPYAQYWAAKCEHGLKMFQSFRWKRSIYNDKKPNLQNLQYKLVTVYEYIIKVRSVHYHWWGYNNNNNNNNNNNYYYYYY